MSYFKSPNKRPGRNFRGGGRLPNRMMMRLIIAAIAGIVAWFTGNKDSEKVTEKAPSVKHTAQKQQGEFDVYLNCSLASSKYNDGDSFLVSHGGAGKQEYRLYFVDTPESKDKPYEDHKKRVGEQGVDLGGLSYQETLKIGKAAKAFTTQVLKKPFTIFTTHELVYGGPRKYAFVQVEYKGGARWLHELLIENGLARVHTRGAETPDGNAYQKQKKHLKNVEKKARKESLGAWGS